MQYTTGQIVRTHPAEDGSFSVFQVEGPGPGALSELLQLLQLREIGFIAGFETLSENTEIRHPDTVELYEYSCNVGKYRIGDRVRQLGMPGEWTVLYFHFSRFTGELMAVCENDAGAVSPRVAHLVKRV